MSSALGSQGAREVLLVSCCPELLTGFPGCAPALCVILSLVRAAMLLVLSLTLSPS